MNFLKKNNKVNKGIIICAGMVILLTIIIASIYPYIKKRELKREEMSVECLVGNVSVDGKEIKDGSISILCKGYGKMGISDIKFTEHEGIVDIKVMGAKLGFNGEDEFETRYSSTATIKQVRISGELIWEDGYTISKKASDLYKSKHPYIGSTGDNGKTFSALKMYEILGDYKIELETKKEPYTVKIMLTDEIKTENLKYFENYMRYCAYSSIAVIDNLSNFTFEYRVKDEKDIKQSTWGIDTAKKELKQDIKKYGESEIGLQKLKIELAVID